MKNVINSSVFFAGRQDRDIIAKQRISPDAQDRDVG